MSIHFSESDLLNIATGNERRGIAFYEVMARSVDDETVSHTFLHLASMEREHILIFEEMLPEVGKSSPADMDPEYREYLQSLLDSAVFTDDLLTSELTVQADTVAKALEVAIRAEKDAILFYYELRDLLPARLGAIDRIISEEKSHLRQLSALKQGLGD
ncbi:MAG: ferritin family protein [Chloroflexota bacterium]